MCSGRHEGMKIRPCQQRLDELVRFYGFLAAAEMRWHVNRVSTLLELAAKKLYIFFYADDVIRHDRLRFAVSLCTRSVVAEPHQQHLVRQRAQAMRFVRDDLPSCTGDSLWARYARVFRTLLDFSITRTQLLHWDI